MKPQLLKVSKDFVHSFSARRDTTPDINNRWHYHPEIELIYLKKGHGTQFLGDSITPFLDGDLILIGSNLPHYWQFDEAYFEASATKQKLSADVVVVHFDQNFWGNEFLNLPENKLIRDTLEQAKRGIKISGEAQQTIGAKIEKIVNQEGVSKIICLMEILLNIGESKDNNFIASVGFQHNILENEKDRIYTIYKYALANFKKKITLEEISGIANMSPNSFCRYFKSKTRKSFSTFLNEIRVSHACKLLIENELHVKEICYESGFYNFSSFHKCFKNITGKNPLKYHKSFKK
ncbi:AraC family transcriptional regulator [Mucilaginibacter polytrichastri]|uniref:HTH araC/xylS-type domain-containing protein n=1 Tax=Mucilaginibacter polytrichastri TaxID=1302689 RepID=A0A1Q5ZX28_9SPHI|nr:helix-turn-helix domain-containing protein [Mucilaginibacter polytrichastri]OKS86311.1 hypothetical protein RG47T_1763 [Mucilaginibacter polytrichastri]SFT16824.1 AraC-type DNA-binding protein [Mucilaginibacter polytrichastri]